MHGQKNIKLYFLTFTMRTANHIKMYKHLLYIYIHIHPKITYLLMPHNLENFSNIPLVMNICGMDIFP